MLDRRRTARRQTYLGARIAFNHRQSTLDCLVRNLGDHGAKLAFADTAYLPDEFDVRIARLERSVRARVTWRQPAELGVVFVQLPPGGRVIPLDQAIRLRELKAENATLTRRVAQLSGAD